MLGYTGNGPSHAAGTWSTSDGKLCVSDQWTGAWGTNHSNECQLWARDSAKPRVLYRSEPSKGGGWTVTFAAVSVPNQLLLSQLHPQGFYLRGNGVSTGELGSKSAFVAAILGLLPAGTD
jgi:hypothetical protein